jgi:hypothetical protein
MAKRIYRGHRDENDGLQNAIGHVAHFCHHPSFVIVVEKAWVSVP